MPIINPSLFQSVFLEDRVVKPLQQLLDAFHSPGRLIQKRTDKLLDYSASSQKAEKNKDTSKNRIVSLGRGRQN